MTKNPTPAPVPRWRRKSEAVEKNLKKWVAFDRIEISTPNGIDEGTGETDVIFLPKFTRDKLSG